MILTESEKQILNVFRSAGFNGHAFRSEEALWKHLEATVKQGIECPGHGRGISEAVCSWHRGGRDPVCRDCLRMEE